MDLWKIALLTREQFWNRGFSRARRHHFSATKKSWFDIAWSIFLQMSWKQHSLVDSMKTSYALLTVREAWQASSLNGLHPRSIISFDISAIIPRSCWAGCFVLVTIQTKPTKYCSAQAWFPEGVIFSSKSRCNISLECSQLCRQLVWLDSGLEVTPYFKLPSFLIW